MRIPISILLSLLIISCGDRKPEVNGVKLSPATIWGERAITIGDFNGDYRIDTLRERYLSGLTKQETNKFFDVPYDSMVALAVAQKPYIEIVHSGNAFDPLTIDSETGQMLGLSYLTNIGDNNRNDRDEIALVIDQADWSAINFLIIYELNDNNKWVEKCSFEIRDFDSTDSLISRDVDDKIIVQTYQRDGEKIDSVIEVVN